MTTLKVTAGYPGGPTIGTNFFTSEILRNAVMHFIIVDNIPINDMVPDPEYYFDTAIGKMEWVNSNTWQPSNKIIFVYSKCGC